MATVHCSKCTAERKGFRRELDSWRHKLIHCIGFESILEGIYGPLLLRDLNLFDDCEPEEVIDWSPEESSAQCSFCHLSLDKYNDQATSPLSSPSDYSPCHVPILSESSQSAHRFLQAVFHKKDVPQDCDPNIPIIAQELMKKMIRQFAMEYASKCLLHTTSNGVPRKTTSPPSETTDAPLDLTMSRAQEEKEPQPDGVLDLSNRKSASLPTSKPSVSSINHKGSGCCLSKTTVQEPGEPEHQGTKNSALGAVLSSLCLAHQSLVYRILKLAHQQKLLFFKTLKQVEPECYCCHCGKHFDNHISHHGAMSDCTPCGCCQRWLVDHCSSMYHAEDSNPTCSTHQFALKDCGHETARDSNSCSTPFFKRETCTIICPKKVHGHSCQSLSSTKMDNVLCTYRPTAPSPSSVLNLCPLSMCCSQHNNQTCSCHLMHSSPAKVKSTKCTEDGSDISVLKTEQSPSLLSPISPDLKKEDDEIYPALHHTEQQETEPVAEKCQSNANFKSTVKKQKCKTTQSSQTKKKSSGILKQSVNQFSDKLVTIKPLERGVSLHTASVAEKQQLPGASKNVQLNDGAHLTEIITTVLHTGSASEQSLSDIDHQNNKEPHAPNTRFRHRQEMLAAVETLAGDATNRRQTPIKRELARLDLLYSKQKRTKLKTGKNIFKYPASQSDKSEVANCKTVKNVDKSSSSKNNVQHALEQSNNLGKPRKSKRTIVPPPRFSSYVTEPRKMYFVACFSDTIFNQRGQTDETVTPPQMSHDASCASQSTSTFSVKDDCQSQAARTAVKEQSPIHHSDTVSMRRRSPKQEETLPDVTIPSDDTCVEYTSPIKLMFVSPVKDEEGMKYSLKSAAAVYGSQADECFDPCEESSWSGTPEKNTCQGTEHATQSPVKSSGSPAKPAGVSARFSPNKTSPNKSSAPEKSDSTPKSSTSSPKAGSRRSGEITPIKCAAVGETHISPHDGPALIETTPPKRRPGRPKKMGPQLEKKVKRPIGRPRKEKVIQSAVNEKSLNENPAAPDTEENVNKNLKITVLYGRSRRNKRMVSESFDQLQTEFHDACQAVGLNNNWSMLMNTAKMNSTDLKTAPEELSQEIPLIKPVRVCAKSNIKCQSLDDVAPLRKPGRPAKVKISGISVTVTTVSPRQRKIQINKDKTSPVLCNHKKALFQQPVSAKEPKTITNHHSVSKSSNLELEESKVESKIERNPPVSIRHSERVRKPSIHFLHAVATSSSYSRSSALVRRSKQLLLNKSNCEQKKVESQNLLSTSGEQHLRGQERGKTRSQGLHQISTVSVDSVYSPKEVKWWSASVQQKTLNQEFARRIRLISDSWVSDTVGTKGGNEAAKHHSASTRKSKHSSVVRSLFDCAPNKPSSCSMQQLCSWFMQTTETQSLTIVKKASSRNSYELMHFPRSTNKKTICYSPQAERLRKHLKKFANSVPKSPYDFKRAQRRINRKDWNSTTISASGRHNKMTKRSSKSFSSYQAILYRAKRRFFTRKERKRLMNNKTQHFLNKHVTRSQQLPKLTTKHLPFCGQTLDPAHAAKDFLCSKHVSPETLKECRVFLRKINSLNNGPVGKERDSSTNTLDERSPSLFGKGENLGAVDKAVKTDQNKSPKRACLSDSKCHSLNSVQAQCVEPMKGRSHSVRVVSESIQPPPAKRLRQSRMMGLTGPRWRDFVFGN